MLSKVEARRLGKHLAEPISDYNEMIQLIENHGPKMMNLLGLGAREHVAFRPFKNTHDYKNYAEGSPEREKSYREFEHKDGWPVGYCDSAIAYDRHDICVFLWQIGTRGELFEVLFHELMHVATSETGLLKGPDDVRSFVNERIIIPSLEAMIYSPLHDSFLPRRWWTSKGYSEIIPGLPGRYK